MTEEIGAPRSGQPGIVPPIPRTRLVDRAVEALRSAILGGRLAPGARIRQLVLAEQLGISRTPLREALAKLELEGLVTLLPAGGVRVALVEPGEMLELYDVREVLDGLAARLSAERSSAAERGALRGHLEAMRACVESPDEHTWFTHHVAFHEGIFAASRNSRLAAMTSVVRVSIQRFHSLLLTTPNQLRVASEEHEAVLQAITGRDPQRAEALARAHVSSARRGVRELAAGRRSHTVGAS